MKIYNCKPTRALERLNAKNKRPGLDQAQVENGELRVSNSFILVTIPAPDLPDCTIPRNALEFAEKKGADLTVEKDGTLIVTNGTSETRFAKPHREGPNYAKIDSKIRPSGPPDARVTLDLKLLKAAADALGGSENLIRLELYGERTPVTITRPGVEGHALQMPVLPDQV